MSKDKALPNAFVLSKFRDFHDMNYHILRLYDNGAVSFIFSSTRLIDAVAKLTELLENEGEL